MSPFDQWLRCLQGKECSFGITMRKDQYKYSGRILMSNPQVTLIIEHETVFIVANNNIDYLCVEKDVYKQIAGDIEKSDTLGIGMFYPWLKNLIGADIKADTFSWTVSGKVARVDPNLVYIENCRDFDILRIDAIKEISGNKNVFNIRSTVKFEEVHD